jgi:hypothetical protein
MSSDEMVQERQYALILGNSDLSVSHKSLLKAALREAVEAQRDAFKEMFVRQTVTGIHIPHDGTPVPYLQAWIALLEPKAVALEEIVQGMTMDLDDEEVNTEDRAQEGLTKAHEVAWRILHELQPQATVHHRYLDVVLKPAPMNPLVETMQIRQAALNLINRLMEIWTRASRIESVDARPRKLGR